MTIDRDQCVVLSADLAACLAWSNPKAATAVQSGALPYEPLLQLAQVALKRRVLLQRAYPVLPLLQGGCWFGCNLVGRILLIWFGLVQFSWKDLVDLVVPFGQIHLIVG